METFKLECNERITGRCILHHCVFFKDYVLDKEALRYFLENSEGIEQCYDKKFNRTGSPSDFGGVDFWCFKQDDAGALVALVWSKKDLDATPQSLGACESIW